MQVHLAVLLVGKEKDSFQYFLCSQDNMRQNDQLRGKRPWGQRRQQSENARDVKQGAPCGVAVQELC